MENMRRTGLTLMKWFEMRLDDLIPRSRELHRRGFGAVGFYVGKCDGRSLIISALGCAVPNSEFPRCVGLQLKPHSFLEDDPL